MRALSAADFEGRVSFITGPGRATGKTSLLNAALALLRAAGEKPAFLGVGFDGAAKGQGAEGASEARQLRGGGGIRVEAGELFVSAEAWIGGSSLRPEVLALLPGRSALGRLALARAGRAGTVVLVGPDSNEVVAEAVRIAREEAGARSVLVDGAFNRLTQVARIPEARFYSSVRMDAAGLAQAARGMRVLARLALLPRWSREGRGDGEYSIPNNSISVSGPLTGSVLAGLPAGGGAIIVEDFTKVFLDEAELSAVLRNRDLLVERRVDFGGFVLVLHGLETPRVIEALGPDFPEGLLIENPYDAVPSDRGGAFHAA